MLAYDLNDILKIVPEAVCLVKEASVSENFPIDNKDSALASALRIAYLTKVAGEQVNYVTQEKVAQAVTAFGVGEVFTKMASKIEAFGEAEKQASMYDLDQTLALQQEVLRGELGFGQDLLKVASYAEGVYERFPGKEMDETTHRYSSVMPFGEDELSNALQKRAYLTGDSRYQDILDVVKEVGVETLNLGTREKRASVAKTVANLDRELHYNGDFYKEAFVKQASYNVRLNAKTVPYESLVKMGKDHIGDLIGKDVAASLTGDFANDKAVIESLPMDEKAVLERFL